MKQKNKIDPGGGSTRGGSSEAGQRHGVKGVHDVPDSLGIDTIVIMPVNADRSFLYWEITPARINGKLRELDADPGRFQLMIKVFGADSRKELFSFTVKDRTGQQYIDYHTSFQPLTAEIGILNEGVFTGLLRSRTFPAVSPGVPETEDDMWMRGIRDMYEIVRVPHNKTGKADEISRLYEETASLSGKPLSSKPVQSP